MTYCINNQKTLVYIKLNQNNICTHCAESKDTNYRKIEEEIKEILPLPNMEELMVDKIIGWCTDHLNEEEPDLDSLLYSADDFSNHQNRKE